MVIHMKIAMIVDAWKPILGGGQIVAYELAKRFSEHYNINVDLFVMNLVGYNRGKIEQINENFKIIYVGKKRGLNLGDRILWIFEFIKEFLNHYKKKKYDLIYSHTYLPGVPAKVLGYIFKIPVIYHIHGANNLEIGEKNIMFYVEKILLTKLKYDLEISVLKNFKYINNVNKVIYIPNGVNIEIFEHGYKKFIKYKKNNEFKILFVGRFDKIKGLHILIEAITLIKKQLIDRNARFYFVGYGYEEKHIKNLINKLKLEDLIIFKGKLIGDDLIKEYVTSDLFILPSLSEGFPLTVLEAWACRLPVLATSVGDLPNIIKEDYNGWLVNPGNAKELSEKLKYILNLDRKDLIKIGKNGYNLVRKKYNWNKIIEKIYYELIKTIQGQN